VSRIPDAFIDELLARTDIVELIGARVALKRQGREFSARCPFHDERSPSFTVSPNKQFYHCFGCGAHGSAIKFLMEYDRLEFLDAVEELARRAGMEVPRETRQRNEQGDFAALIDTCEQAARFFRAQLAATPRAQDYVRRRGLNAETVERFAIGYAPAGWDALKNALGTDRSQLERLDKVGLLSKSDSGKVYDKFRDRLVFPIHDRRGRVIAFGGRVLEKDDGPKYLNSPETPLFHKGRELYGLWQVRQAHAKIPQLVVVEGYMDVVALFQVGVTTAVATLGTATTPDHAELLFRNAPDVYFCFDGDRAGRGAAWKALESVLPRLRDGRQAHFLFLPEGDDPDSLVRREGAAGFAAQLKRAVPLSEFFFAEMSREIELGSLDGKARLAERCRPLLAQIPDGAFRDLMAQRLAELSGVGLAAAAQKAPATAAPRAGGGAPRGSLVRTAIALLLQRPALVDQVPESLPFAHLQQRGVGLLIELIELIRSRPGITMPAVLEHFEGREEQAALEKLAMADLLTDPAEWGPEIVGALLRLELDALRQDQATVKARLAAAGSVSALSADDREILLQAETRIRAIEARIASLLKPPSL
jgi:DNA primase